MGFLDKLLKGAKIVGEIASEVSNGQKSAETPEQTPAYAPAQTPAYAPEKSFEEKLQAILQNAGNYELRSSISPDDLEQELGQKIYSRSGCKSPENITYGVYENGNRVLFIRLWDEYALYDHKANRQIKVYCDANGIKMLDFFEYLPNEESYMDQRIRANL